ncbi:hypothetical protein OSB04_028658 [Centaurea solstitialis]|uniref:F-box domain-containing protein n=1 Tax=Centaurea solstitialis TaxID=347529 RepID=A0AA38VXZ4_9ASTR|nr:hypothetical protein OSB04_028658 [Centaurea solstitialis]
MGCASCRAWARLWAGNGFPWSRGLVRCPNGSRIPLRLRSGVCLSAVQKKTSFNPRILLMTTMENIVPNDTLFYHILPSLPAKSLGRFKCVCKQWRSFLATPMFTKMHLHHVNTQNHHKQLIVSTIKLCKYFRTIDCETPEVGLSAYCSLPFEANHNQMKIISSLNGLVCIQIDSFDPRISMDRYLNLILWNPLTGDYKRLPKDNSYVNDFRIPARGYGLYYSCCDDDYKLLRLTIYKNVFIYSLKSDTWRKVEPRRCPLSLYWMSSCLLNENLYFLELSINNMNVRSYSIIRFDTNTEKFTEIAAPSLQHVDICCFSLTVLSGCVYLCASSKVSSWDKLALWKMDGDREWTKVVSCCGRLSKRGFYQPLHVMKNGNWLVGSRRKGCFYEVNLEMKTTKEVCAYTPTPTDGPMDVLGGGKFVETIVSLN